MSYTPKTDEQIREIALGIFKGNLFTNLHIREHDLKMMMPMIFVGLLFMDEEQHKAFVAEKPYLFYGDLKDTFSRSVNGYPMFTQWGYTNREDGEKIMAKLKEIRAAVESVRR
jgi:hypothetical protein